MIGPVAPVVSTLPAATRADEIRKAAEGFEAIFLSSLLKAGRAGLPGDDLTGSAAVRGATAMLDTHLATEAAGRAGFGLAEAIARQFTPPEDRA